MHLNVNFRDQMASSFVFARLLTKWAYVLTNLATLNRIMYKRFVKMFIEFTFVKDKVFVVMLGV